MLSKVRSESNGYIIFSIHPFIFRRYIQNQVAGAAAGDGQTSGSIDTSYSDVGGTPIWPSIWLQTTLVHTEGSGSMRPTEHHLQTA